MRLRCHFAGHLYSQVCDSTNACSCRDALSCNYVNTGCCCRAILCCPVRQTDLSQRFQHPPPFLSSAILPQSNRGMAPLSWRKSVRSLTSTLNFSFSSLGESPSLCAPHPMQSKKSSLALKREDFEPRAPNLPNTDFCIRGWAPVCSPQMATNLVTSGTLDARC